MLKHDINIPLLSTVGAVASLLLLVVLFGVQAWYDWEVNGFFEETWGKADSKPVVDQKKLQVADIESPPRYVRRADGVARVPIATAMDEIIKNNGKLPTTQP